MAYFWSAMLLKKGNFLVPTKGKLFKKDRRIMKLIAFILKANSLITRDCIIPTVPASYIFSFYIYLKSPLRIGEFASQNTTSFC